ncbi:MAG TPA: signal peptidase II [Vicinamibacterales bacterium]|nr:signal peptidase II [Vicinamibacterales bacterium]
MHPETPETTSAPPPPVSRVPPFARPFELGAMGLIVVADQVSKFMVRKSLVLGESRNIIPGFLDLTHVQNTGAAFGLLNAVDFAYKPLIMIAVSACALVAIAAYGTQLGFQDRLARFGLALILGGAFGNLIDRAAAGHVVDFVDVYWKDTHFWAFNVADAAITVGAIFVLLDMFGLGRRHAPHTV